MTILRFAIFILCSFSMQSANSPQEPVQAEVVDFGKLGKIKVEAWELVDEPLKLVFTNAESGRALETLSILNLKAYNPVRIRFRVMHIEGLPDPLILAVANSNGASDCFYHPIPIAKVNGKFRRLLSESPEMDTQGGFSLGSLGTRGGTGLAIWTFEWGAKESHYEHHRYRIKFYRWNRTNGTLVSLGSHVTRHLDDGSDAALAAGISPEDVIDASTLQSWFPEYSC